MAHVITAFTSPSLLLSTTTLRTHHITPLCPPTHTTFLTGNHVQSFNTTKQTITPLHMTQTPVCPECNFHPINITKEDLPPGVGIAPTGETELEMKDAAKKYGPVNISFHPDAVQDDEQLRNRSFALGILSHVSYYDQREIAKKETIIADLLGSKLRNVHHYDEQSAAGMIVETDDALYVVFRGTDEFVDWFDNIFVWPIELPEKTSVGYVHKGFYDHTSILWDNILPKLRELIKEKPRKLVFTGHSLGGAAAVMCSLRYAETDDVNDIDCVITFGQPHIGGVKTANHMNRIFNNKDKPRYFRYTYSNDPVPVVLGLFYLLEFSRLSILLKLVPQFAAYAHCGTQMHIGRNGKVITRNPNLLQAAWGRFMGYLNALRRLRLLRVHLDHHRMENYWHAILPKK